MEAKNSKGGRKMPEMELPDQAGKTGSFEGKLVDNLMLAHQIAR